MSEFTIKDSGKRESFDGGMVRDTEDGKVDYTLVFDGPMFKRWAEHLTKGARKYKARNWMKATGEKEIERFKRSLLRHLVAYLCGETDEDHAAAIFFNINGIEYVKSQREQNLANPDKFVWPEPKRYPEPHVTYSLIWVFDDDKEVALVRKTGRFEAWHHGLKGVFTTKEEAARAIGLQA